MPVPVQPIVIALGIVGAIMGVISLFQSKGKAPEGWGLLALGLAVILLAL